MELYHALNRGVDKRPIFLDNGDRVRFVHDLYSFNDAVPANNTNRFLMNDILSRSSKQLVDIHGWCLMDNHYHLLLSERVEEGLSLFLRKLNVGYAKYFNEKYKRTGTLFQGRTKKILIASDAHFLHILNYIHLNPLDMKEGSGEWRSRTITNSAKALDYLDRYRWSSYLDYCNVKNFPSVLTTSLFKKIFKDYKKEVREYLKDIEKTPIDKNLLLE